MRNLKTIWSAAELDDLAAALTFAYKAQNTYREPLDLDDRLACWQFVLGKRYTMPQVLAALEKFLLTNPTMPVPSDIHAIIDPPKPRITEAQYVAAQRWQERNDYPVFSDARDVIEAYHKQESDKRQEHEQTVNGFTKIASASIKRINHNFPAGLIPARED